MMNEQDIETAAVSLLVTRAKQAGFSRTEDYVTHLLDQRPELRQALQSHHASRDLYQRLAQLLTQLDETDAEIKKRLEGTSPETPYQALMRLGGIGSLASGAGDLSSNPEHLEGFGR